MTQEIWLGDCLELMCRIPDKSVDAIICDPPYQGTTTYKTDKFNHPNFWEWCRFMSSNNIVFISEYTAPQDFQCVWEGEIQTNFASQRKKAKQSIEKLFKFCE